VPALFYACLILAEWACFQIKETPILFEDELFVSQKQAPSKKIELH
jgi:hypothetical protein